ncbi:bifunctional S-methyl-5'-thioadenosine deaminase/S-adenosylhomocysteine deaminase [Metabacillus sediminilitoris]|uniref:5-methylthioadenosine/S-adenosylhomocysteine deaminase n=2 Tax=Metabacillus sediminilitoris TaxID=2567941 RepID=A0A4S4BJE8_9BACI|nr:amidohydrolase family protein [Metabacillus sediminilitoris]THF74784.1 bifunctional S-methyl-5'-thioadenosine deaminase/S-adenosylhomocysteine deaminase [Metabacillus sediminilitoris]
MKIAYLNADFYTMDMDNHIFKNGMMIVDDQKISYIGPSSADLLSDADQVVDLRGKWVLPGLVNVHSHILMTILRGNGDDMLLKPWLETKIWPIEAKFTTEIASVSAQLGMLEMLKSGTTTFSDMFNPNGIDADVVMEVIGETGMRGAFSYSIFSFGTEQEQKANLTGAERFSKTYKTYANGRLTAMVAPHSPYACTPEAIAESARIAKENDLMVHIHVSETDFEVLDIEKRYGVRPVEFLRRLGLFDQPTVMAHGVVLNDEERSILKQYDVRVAHNPISNLKLGSGIADVVSLLDKGIKVGIATDGVASNNNFDMFEETRTAALLQKGVYKDATKFTAQTALSLATRVGAEAIGMGYTGSLEAGKKADFLTIYPYDKAHLQPLSEAYSHLLYAASGRDVCDVYIDGKLIVKDGNCLTIDEEKVMAEVNRLHADLTR